MPLQGIIPKLESFGRIRFPHKSYTKTCKNLTKTQQQRFATHSRCGAVQKWTSPLQLPQTQAYPAVGRSSVQVWTSCRMRGHFRTVSCRAARKRAAGEAGCKQRASRQVSTTDLAACRPTACLRHRFCSRPIPRNSCMLLKVVLKWCAKSERSTLQPARCSMASDVAPQNTHLARP